MAVELLPKVTAFWAASARVADDVLGKPRPKVSARMAVEVRGRPRPKASPRLATEVLEKVTALCAASARVASELLSKARAFWEESPTEAVELLPNVAAL